MPTINIEIKNKIAKSPAEHIVCGNSDFKIKFLFDEEWAAYNVKTARFIYNGHPVDVVFEGDTCDVPKISGANVCEVGVYAGDLHTTTPALVACYKSILCKGGVPADPMPDVYAQLMEKLNKITGLDGEVVARALAAYLAENPLQENDPTVPGWAKQQNKPSYTAQEVGALSAEALPAAINEALAQAKASGAFDGADGKDGYTPIKGVDYFDGEPGQPGKDGADGKPGTDGRSPVKGVDYFTPEEVQEIAEQAAEMVEVPEGGGEWETILDIDLEVTDASVIEQSLEKFGFDEYVASIEFVSVDSNENVTVNGHFTVYVDGNRVSYYTTKSDFDKNTPTFIAKIYPVRATLYSQNQKYVRTKMADVSLWEFSAADAATATMSRMVCSGSNGNPTGTIKIQMPAAYTGRLLISVIAK